MCSEKDYIRASKIVASYRLVDKSERILVREAFVSFFRGENPAFDVERFRNACEPIEHGFKEF